MTCFVHAQDNATTDKSKETIASRVEEFFQSVFTGQSLKEDDWIPRELQEYRLFRSFGGLEGAIEASTNEALEHSGLKYIIVENIELSNKNHLVNGSIEFMDGYTKMFNLRLKYEDEKWKIYIMDMHYRP